ncbi:hypothetical protein NDU88_001150 [Pleurodeles waltl]|uniref:Uncharacterized protein n=1 Tax=Pleurodeles waltl TaxID=8319 RepID=A0AAV7L8N0_PLEWA|nr:hypothetical protein NDU88_001150 [Pleurodeles waltl]
MEVRAGRRMDKEPDLGFSDEGGDPGRRRIGAEEKNQADERTQDFEVLSVPTGDERRVKSRTTDGPTRKKTSQSPGGGIH